ncbi:MAG: hypothetical protein PHS41_08605 [Victivallaceae bacterium]|nr:hypothetical protein [Victivallaceae bacterium]
MKWFSVVLSALAAVQVVCAAAPAGESRASRAELQVFAEQMQRASDPGNVAKTVKTMTVASLFEFPSQGLKIPMKMYYAAPDKFRTETEIPGMTSIEIVNGKKAAKVVKGLGTLPVPDRELLFKEFRLRLMDPKLKFTELFENPTMDSRPIMVDGRSCRRLTGGLPPALKLPPVEYLVDEKTALPYRTVMTLPTELGDVPTVTTFEEYKNLSGLMIATRQTSKIMNMNNISHITKVEINPPLSDKLFDTEHEE